MGCDNSKQGSIERPGGKLLVWGDYFSPETRTLLNIMSVCSVPYDFQLIDQLKGMQKQDEYLLVNPTGQIPTITDVTGKFFILGGYGIYLQYLCNHHPKIRAKLYPEDHKVEIDKHMMWFQSLMRVSTQRIVKMMVGPKAFGDRQAPVEDIKRETDEFYKKILPRLEKQISGKKYMVGEGLTVIDLQYYNDIRTIVDLTRQELTNQEFPTLSEWFNETMPSIPEVLETDARFKAVLTQHQ